MKKVLFIAAFAAAALISCKKEEATPTTPVENKLAKVEVKLTVNEASADVLANADIYFIGRDFAGKEFSYKFEDSKKGYSFSKETTLATDYSENFDAALCMKAHDTLKTQADYSCTLDYKVSVIGYDKDGNVLGESRVFGNQQAGTLTEEQFKTAYCLKGAAEYRKYLLAKGNADGKLNFGWKSEDAAPAPLEYAGATYKTILLANGDIWMAEPLCVVPTGQTVSDNPATGKVCYPQGFSDIKVWRDTTWKADTISSVSWKHSETFAALKDEASIKACGLLYSWDVIFGEAITATNYNTFEGKQGICPEGWHVPTKAEWKSVIGNATGETAATYASYYNTKYDGGVIGTMESDGFMWGFTGMINAKAYGKTNVITSTMSNVKGYIGKAALTYAASSTGKTPAVGKSATQMWSAMSTFSAGTYDKTTKTLQEVGKFPNGRLAVSFANFAGGFVQVRCIKNK